MVDSTNRQTLRLLDKSQNVSERSLSGADTKEFEDELDTANGINIWQTAISLSGVCAGLGFLAVDVLVVSTGWIGFFLFILLYAALLYTSIILGRCWNMVRDKWGHERHPYGAIGYEAFGGLARSLINILVAAVCFSNAIVVLMGFSEMTLTIGGAALEGTLCYWPLAYGLVICPFFWLATPKSFWWIMASSFFTVVMSVILVITSVFVAGSPTSSGINATEEVPRESAFFHLTEIAGTVFWLMAQHGCIPTLQQDMQQPQGFSKAIILADLMTLFLTLPVMLALVITYGNTLTNVSGSAIVYSLLPEDALKKVSASLIMVHLTGAVLLVNNPLFQYLEEVLHIPIEFSWKRVVLRSSVLLMQIFVQETVPHFTLLSSISGGFLTPLISFLVPCLFYLRLRKTYQPEPTKWSMLETIACVVIIAATPCIIVAILFGTGTAIASGRTAFTVPCYVNATLAGL
ncbi:amino acid transporter AVT1I-like [Acanthaster planci]|uniref:Amino acid transporter AVT1I-like n=1 Tax=Acanthaster planci TaxID=133434 RepID=A0A8B7Y8G0_ACAPL|nr:amino acid transporter AVT1I-like [Acanthaster planci]